MATLRTTLCHAVTSYDARQSKKRCYNVYALPQYLGRVADICDDIDAGANPYDAINAGFHGPLLAHVTKTVAKAHPDIPPATQSRETSGWTYQPASKR